MPRYRIVTDTLAALSRKPLVEKLARVLDPVADDLESHREMYDTLTGESLTGHPIHPALVHFPIGITMGAAALEIVGLGRFTAATTVLSGITVATALPTAVTGLAEWTRGRPDTRQRHVGALHAMAASAGTTLSLLSFVLRLMRAHGAARIFLFGAAGAYGVAGFIGGDLVYGRDLAQDGDEEAV
ncbi:DUF2231 domain-containing protein [Tessaracoccus antarcticus]|uniref:DUF2231 domain-containing protein n=1 Tax=Tessaracoccus antarcticus TaxID=2479848 RepID=A0A3M0GS50_9ACTN|nr:DUF2231 domain-containing protein [Tessaracoccus antarcticus]RMB60136.1 hypothetical protein EAX62_10610 [Tessaracoccus antarcticus]